MIRLAFVAALGAVCAAGGGAPAADGRACTTPTLAILSPRSGETVKAPFPVRYRVRCFRVGPGSGHLHAWLNPERNGMRVELPLRRTYGTVTFPDHPLFSGRRTVLFELARADHPRVRARMARVVVLLMIEGMRSP
jgi:hypothetical protein